MAHEPRTVAEQLELLKNRGMLVNNEHEALQYLANISYYRLKGYWWDMQSDKVEHEFEPDTYFHEVIDRYNFDRQLRLILFDAIEHIEIALRTKLIYHLSLAYGPNWYSDSKLFNDEELHKKHLNKLQEEFGYSNEIFIKEHKRKHRNTPPESWKILEVSTMGTLSKLYKNLNHQLPEKSIIAKEMGLNLHNELSSWLEAIVYVRNITAHHSRLWSRNMVKRPTLNILNPKTGWLNKPLTNAQAKKPFLIISCMLYICNNVVPKHKIKQRIINLFNDNPEIPIYKLGFLGSWKEQNLWYNE